MTTPKTDPGKLVPQINRLHERRKTHDFLATMFCIAGGVVAAFWSPTYGFMLTVSGLVEFAHVYLLSQRINKLSGALFAAVQQSASRLGNNSEEKLGE